MLAAYGTCHLHGWPVDKSLPPGLLDLPEVDEIIPASKGGSPYLFFNCRFAHRWCNRIRSNHSVAWTCEHTKQVFEQEHMADLKVVSMLLVISGDWRCRKETRPSRPKPSRAQGRYFPGMSKRNVLDGRYAIPLRFWR